MTDTYDTAEVERLTAEARALGSRDRQGFREAMAEQLEAARARIAELEGALTAACDIGEPLRGHRDPRLRGPHRVELLPVFTTVTTREQLATTWVDLSKTAKPR